MKVTTALSARVRSSLSMGRSVGFGCACIAAASAAFGQAIDHAAWVEEIQLYQHRVASMDMEGDVLVVAHLESGGFGRGASIFERDRTTNRWTATQELTLPSIGSAFDSVHFEQGRIFAGGFQFVGSPEIQVYERDVAGVFTLVDSISTSAGAGWSLHADGDRLFAISNEILEIYEPGATGSFSLQQSLALGTNMSSLGGGVIDTQDDWLFLDHRGDQELVILLRDPATGQYAEHSRRPYVGVDFSGDFHDLTSSPGRLLFSSSGAELVHEYRYDADSDAWSLVHTIFPSVPAQFTTRFGSTIGLEGNRLVVAAPRAERFSSNSGGFYIFDFDPIEDVWNESLILRGRELPFEFQCCEAAAIGDGWIALSTGQAQDFTRNIEVTFFDTASDADNTLAVDATEVGTTLCDPAVINFSYVAGRLAAMQPSGPSTASLDLLAQHLPRNTFGFAVSSSGSAFIPTPGGSRGNLCLAPGPDLGRFVQDISNTGDAGWFSTTVDLSSIPVATGVPQVLTSGDVWYFQVWYRDGPTSNFTNAVEVTVP